MAIRCVGPSSIVIQCNVALGNACLNCTAKSIAIGDPSDQSLAADD